MGNHGDGKENLKSIQTLSQRWYPRVPKKFNISLINDVHQIVSRTENLKILQTLHETKYFDYVLWNNFEKDSTNKHIELVILLVLFDIEQKNDEMINKVLNDVEKFQQLLERILSTTETFNESSDLRFHSHVLQFVNQLITLKLSNTTIKKSVLAMYDISIWSHLPNYEDLLDEDPKNSFYQKREYIENCASDIEKAYLRLKERWLFSILKTYMDLVLTKDFDDIVESNKTFSKYFIRYSENLLCLLISSVSQLPLRHYFNTVLRYSRFISIFHSVGPNHSRLLEFVKILQHFIYFPIDDFTGEESLENNAYQDNFYNLQKTMFSEFSKLDRVKQFFMIPSVYDYSPIALEEFLSTFKDDELVHIVSSLNGLKYVPIESKNPRFIIQIIINEVFIPTYDVRSLFKSIKDFNEINLIDEFEKKFNISSLFQPIPLPPLNNVQYLSLNDYLYRSVVNTINSYQKELNQHIFQVLQRLKISVDFSSNLSIKGSSKYFAKIEKFSISKNSKAELIVQNNKEWNSQNLRKNDFIALIELIKPNIYSPHIRINKFGLNSVKLVKVLEFSGTGKSRKLLIEWDDTSEEELHERLNCIIKLPNTSNTSNLLNLLLERFDLSNIKLPKFLHDLFLGIDKPKVASYECQPNRPYKLKVNCLNIKELEKDYEVSNHSEKAKKRKTNDSSIAGDNSSYLLHFSGNNKQVDVKSIDESVSTFQLTPSQAKGLISSISTGLTLIETSPHSGTKVLLNAILSNLHLNFNDERTLIVVPDNNYLNKFVIDKSVISKSMKFDESYISLQIAKLFELAGSLLLKVEKLSSVLGLEDFGFNQSCENALLLYKLHITKRWENFLYNVKQDKDNISNYPFKQFSDVSFGNSYKENFKKILKSYKSIVQIFEILEQLAPLIKFQKNTEELTNYLINRFSNFVFITSDHLISNPEIYQFKFNTVISINNHDLLSILLPIFNNSSLKRLVLLKDSVANKDITSLYSRFKYLKVPSIALQETRGIRSEFLDLYAESYHQLTFIGSNLSKINAGFYYTHQLIHVSDDEPSPNVSVAEAEYSVALYQYMRLLGYPSSKITILSFTPIQKALIEEILTKRCGKHSSDDSLDSFKFGWPSVEPFHSSSSEDFIIVSLYGFTHPSQVLSCFTKARAGLYLVGRLPSNPWNIPAGPLKICNGESFQKYSAKRSKSQIYTLEDFEHIGQYVYEMSKTRMAFSS